MVSTEGDREKEEIRPVPHYPARCENCGFVIEFARGSKFPDICPRCFACPAKYKFVYGDIIPGIVVGKLTRLQ